MTTTSLGAAAPATEFAYLVDLPVDRRGPADGDRYDQVRWALGSVPPEDRMIACAAAIQAVDPNHCLGHHPDPAEPLTVELYAFENRRVERIYYAEEPRSEVAHTLLLVTGPILHSYPPEELLVYSHVGTLLAYGQISEDEFPGFSFRDHLRGRGTDLHRWDAAAKVYADGLRALACPVDL